MNLTVLSEGYGHAIKVYGVLQFSRAFAEDLLVKRSKPIATMPLTFSVYERKYVCGSQNESQ